MALFGLPRQSQVGSHAPDFPEELEWLNGGPLSLGDLKDKVVLLDFWTYSCVNCLRTLPYLKRWHEKYSGEGLVIIGVHTPEFEFEKERANVERFLEKEGIEYPVVLDSERQVWQAYANRFWPRKFLIDHNGIIRYDHIGEGAYEETEEALQALLTEGLGVRRSMPAPEDEYLVTGEVCYPTTPELYCGTKRGLLGNPEGFGEGNMRIYTDPGDYVDGRVYLEGPWRAEDERVVYGNGIGSASGLVLGGSHISIRYHGLEVNAVMGAESTVNVEVTRDGHPLEKRFAGEDIVFEGERSLVRVAEHRMYNLLEDSAFENHVLRLEPQAPHLEMYAFTFGGCERRLDMVS